LGINIIGPWPLDPLVICLAKINSNYIHKGKEKFVWGGEKSIISVKQRLAKLLGRRPPPLPLRYLRPCGGGWGPGEQLRVRYIQNRDQSSRHIRRHWLVQACVQSLYFNFILTKLTICTCFIVLNCRITLFNEKEYPTSRNYTT